MHYFQNYTETLILNANTTSKTHLSWLKKFPGLSRNRPQGEDHAKVQFKPHVLFFVPPGDPQVLDQGDTGAQCDHGKNQTPIKHKQHRKYFLTYV